MKPPRFWYKTHSLLALVLGPFAAVYRALAAWRLRQPGQRAGCPVICVGNLNIGGTGKTPTVIALAEILTDLGHHPVVVTRGYGGRLQGPLQVDARKHRAGQVGDEPLLLAAFLPVIVAKDRLQGAQAAVAAGADIILLDDGFQNPALIKDQSLIVVDAEIGFGNGRVFPAGPNRETLRDALARIDGFVLIGKPQARAALLKSQPLLSRRPVFEAELKPLMTGMDWAGLRAYAFAGIGRPQKFYDTLADLGVALVRQTDFDDHEIPSPKILERMEKEANALGAQLVTTEKDMTRLDQNWRSKILTLPVRLAFDAPAQVQALLQDLVDPAKQSQSKN